MKDPLLYAQRRIGPLLRDRRTIASAAAVCLTATVCYLYVLVGNINNYDNIACTPAGYGTGLRSGRWLLTLLGDAYSHFLGNYNLPLFNGLVGLLFLGLACQLLFRTLRLEQPWQCALLSVITVAFPAAASAMLFSFTVHYYLLAVLLASASVWLVTRRGTGCFILSAVLLCCSIGLYQAYFPLAAAVLVLRLLRDCLDEAQKWKTVALRALRYVGMLAAAMILYFLVLRLCLAVYHESLLPYRGIDRMGLLPLDRLPELLWREIRCFYLLAWENYAFLAPTRLVRWAICGSVGLSALWLILNRHERDPKKLVTVLLLLAALPIAANGIFLMAPDAETHTLMTYGVVTLFYLPLVVLSGTRRHSNTTRRWVGLLTALCLLGAAIGYAWQANSCYRTNYYANRVISSYYQTMLTRAKNVEGYTAQTEIVFVGRHLNDPSLHDVWADTPFIFDGRSTASGQINEYSRVEMIAAYLGTQTRYATDEELATYAAEFDTMPCYPDDGAIRLLDGTLYIKLCDPSYTSFD